jgi:hypothetical protein
VVEVNSDTHPGFVIQERHDGGYKPVGVIEPWEMAMSIQAVDRPT